MSAQPRSARLLVCLLIAGLLAGLPVNLVVARSSQPQASGELLANPGFEQPFNQEGSADRFVANGWTTWYLTPDGVNYPTDCKGKDVTCKAYNVPVYRNTQPQDAKQPPRARSGDSQQWGVAYAIYIAGVYQRVTNITPGAQLKFSAYLQGFNCDDDRGCFGPDGEYGKSYEPGNMQTRVGIDPTGGTDPYSTNIVWSGFQNPLDAFSQHEVEAVAQGSTVTVFLWSSPTFPELHTDVYADDASLTVIGQGPTPTAGAPATAPTSAPGTPRATVPAGTGTYTIQSGDTLSAIALQYNLTLDQLLALNPDLSRDSVLSVGQNINVGGTPVPTTPTVAPTAVAPTAAATATASPATPTPTPPISTTQATLPAPTTAAASTSTPAAIAAASGLCLASFDDVNGNGIRDNGEALVAGAAFDVKGADGKSVNTYSSDGLKDPYCLTNLPDGRYSVDVTPPVDRLATTDTRWSLSLLSGTAVNIAFGSQAAPSETATPTKAPTATAQPAGSGSGSSSLTLLVGGAFVLLAIAALFLGLRPRGK